MKREFNFPSKDGLTQIHVIEWMPEGEVTAVLQMCHGMVEHIGRYDEFAEFLSQRGVYVVGHDHLGHGKSIASSERLGFFGEPDGNEYVIGDIHELRTQTQEKYPNVPYFMLGHSMGSFLLRQYIGLHSEGLAGAIIIGTGYQPGIVLAGGKLICKVIGAIKGWNYRSEFVNNLAVGGYRKKYGMGWLSNNAENVEKYSKDPLSGFVFTVNAYYHMFNGMSRMNQLEKEKKALKTLPILFLSGEDDPVGDNGNGVVKSYNRYKDHGYQDVRIKLYRGDKHEILNELDREEVYHDILYWLEKRK